ncbi:hypothetical protein WM24_23700 [Burkholderia ubonensis]|uniref:hypothetical protein n=1 Tax=Burkholderia ubonensis TaxID=101571 RepID=UPI0007521A71|nr:hypothetical protein [Burkholderia ubonensis]KWN80844.1 hypothetical protein WM24_23700 [Burkholderia ubonensis]
MRRAARVDDNQAEIVVGLRKIGASVTPIHQVGNGCPDLAVGYRGRTVLFELKDPKQPLSKRKLTDDEAIWFGSWRGEAYVIETIEQAIEYLTRPRAGVMEVSDGSKQEA